MSDLHTGCQAEVQLIQSFSQIFLEYLYCSKSVDPQIVVSFVVCAIHAASIGDVRQMEEGHIPHTCMASFLSLTVLRRAGNLAPVFSFFYRASRSLGLAYRHATWPRSKRTSESELTSEVIFVSTYVFEHDCLQVYIRSVRGFQEIAFAQSPSRKKQDYLSFYDPNGYIRPQNGLNDQRTRTSFTVYTS